jgi:hypothetical protein
LSLLIIRCPLKPFAGLLSGLPNDWQDLACAEQFEWCLIEDLNTPHQFFAGQGMTDSLPYADEALVMIPTLDVRLIEAKVPLANAKKIQQILPNLIEEYLLSGAEAMITQVLPPIPGQPALQRTLAIIDRAWFSWLCTQFEGLLSNRIRVIPECLILPTVDYLTEQEVPASAQYQVAYQKIEGSIIITQRTSLQIGTAWVETIGETGSTSLILPSVFGSQPGQGHDIAKAFAWDWLAASAVAYLQENASSKSVNFALNLLPKDFKHGGKKLGLGGFLGKRQGTQDLQGDSAIGLTALAAWLEPMVWRRPLQWFYYGMSALVLGFVLQLAYLVWDNSRWASQMELLAAQSLTPASVSALAQSKSSDLLNTAKVPTTVLGAFITQVTQEQRRQGQVSDADFVSMSAKLQQLKSVFGPEVLQSIRYDGYGIDFEFKPESLTSSKHDAVSVSNQGRALGLVVKSLGANRYRLEPYAGLGMGS